MIEKRAAEWLFPLAFSKEDELIRFYACLAVTVLAANREIEKEVVKSGTLELVEPFIASLDPEDFARSLLDSADSMQGRTASDLQQLLPLLDGTRVEGKCIAAFYLCVEASIKSRQRNTKVKLFLLFNKLERHQMYKIINNTSSGWHIVFIISIKEVHGFFLDI